MNKTDKITLNASLWHLEYSKFKHKQALIIKSLIENARLHKIYKFNSYGEITFAEDDVDKWHPIVSKLDDFNRNKCNALIWDIDKTEVSPDCIYDKVIIYTDFYNTQKITYYGIYFYSSDTGKCTHHYTINSAYDAITKHLHNFAESIRRSKLIQKYVDKDNMLKAMIDKRLNKCA